MKCNKLNVLLMMVDNPIVCKTKKADVNINLLVEVLSRFELL